MCLSSLFNSLITDGQKDYRRWRETESIEILGYHLGRIVQEISLLCVRASKKVKTVIEMSVQLLEETNFYP